MGSYWAIPSILIPIASGERLGASLLAAEHVIFGI